MVLPCNVIYKLLYHSITVRVRTGVLYRLESGIGLVLVLRFCALKFITSNDCSAVELVRLPDAHFLSLGSGSRPVDTD